MSVVTHILGEIKAGDPQAASQLLPLIYDELRNLATLRMASERKDHTLQGTALVHEAYLRLVGPTGDEGWDSRGHFFAAAAEAMRRILVEQARRKNSLKAGGEHERMRLSEIEPEMSIGNLDLLALDESLTRLQLIDPRKAELVKLRFFSGLTQREAAETLGISVSTADNEWAYAKGWLRVDMAK